MARSANPLQLNHNSARVDTGGRNHPEGPDTPRPPFPPVEKPGPRIGVFQDAAFQFYYPENLDALTRAGGQVVAISPLQDSSLPQVDALYLGGGFPETLALGLSENESFMTSLREATEAGLPVYAECGGAVYLGKTLHYDGKAFPLVGVLPVEYGFQEKPRGHGYRNRGREPLLPPGPDPQGA
jgi:cobyrinic acid a,c-diamide synthase